jgi:IS4 transposase
MLNVYYSAKRYPGHRRRIRLKNSESGKALVFLINNKALPGLTICALYQCRWQVEFFFKWKQQHLRIKDFLPTARMR